MPKRNNYHDTGILLLRAGFGIMFLFHGMPKLMQGGPEWEKLGHNMSAVGISFWPAFWGFLSAFTEFAGGILLILGFYTRTAAVFLFINMVIAILSHGKSADFFKSGSHAMEAAIVFLSLIFIGSGRFSIDGMVGRR